MAKNTIKLSEQELHKIIKESVEKVLTENEMEEGLWNQVKSGWKTFTGNQKPGQGGLYNRFDNARQNFQAQGKLDNLNTTAKTIVDFMNSRNLDWGMTVEQLINKMMGNRLTMAKQMKGRGGKGYFSEE